MKSVPIKELKDTASFAKLVKESEQPILVTKNGYDEFVVMSVDQHDALSMEVSRLKLYRHIDAAEEDFAVGHTIDAQKSQRAARERYGL